MITSQSKANTESNPSSRIEPRWVLLGGVAPPLLSLVLALLLADLSSGLARALPSVYKQDGHVTLALCREFPDLYGCEAGVGLLTGREIADLSTRVGVTAGPLLNLLLAFGVTVWLARKAGARSRGTAAQVGLLSAFTGGLVAALYSQRAPLFGGLQAIWTLSLLVLVPAGAWLGGVVGRASLAGQQALFAASRALRAADSPQAIVAAIGQHLDGLEVSHVSLWEAADGTTPGTLRLLAAWGTPSLSPGLCLDPVDLPSLTQLERNAPFLIRAYQTPPAERSAWQRLGVRTALLLPLNTAAGPRLGWLVVASQTARRFQRGMWRAEVLSAQVALALENSRLLEQARRAGVLEERQRLAREIHDTLAQGFTSIVLHLEAAEAALPDSGPGHAPSIQPHLDQARQTARDSLAQARRLVWALRPEILERTTLSAAVERVVARWAEDNQIEANTIITGTVCPLPSQVEVTLLRAVQEALTNAGQHARAERVAVTLSYMSDLVVLDVQDNGIGFDPASVDASSPHQAAGGFGLIAMRERVEQLGGTLLIESAPGEGTTLVVEIPTAAEGPA